MEDNNDKPPTAHDLDPTPETDDPTIRLQIGSVVTDSASTIGESTYSRLEGEPDDVESGEYKRLLSSDEKEASLKFDALPLKEISEDGEVAYYLTKEDEEQVLGPVNYTLCGVGFLKNAWLQKLARPEVYLLAFSIAGITQGMNFAYAGGTMTTIQRRFGLSSKTSGFITIGNDLFEIFLSVYIAYFAGNGHRPRWIAAGILLAIFSCWVFMTPHLIFGAGNFEQYEKNVVSASIISINQTETTTSTTENWYSGCNSLSSGEHCEEEVDPGSFTNEQYTVIALQFIAMVLLGLVNSVYYSVGYSYLDDAVSKEKIPIYFSIAGTLRILGPVSGLALSSWSLRMWINPTATPSITTKSPNWIGAWWLGYLIISASMVVPMCMLMMMPRQLPSTRIRQTSKLRAAAKQGYKVFKEYAMELRPTKAPTLKDMIPGLKRLFRNRIFLCIITNQFFFWGTLVAQFIFSTKYVENQFRMSAADANEYTAVLTFLASVSGLLGTGSMLSWLQPKTKTVLYTTIIISIGLIASTLSQFLVNCEWGEIYGLKEVLHADNVKSHTQTSLEECMSDCNCGSEFSPVCVSQQYTYYSACHAGCSSSSTYNTTATMYSDCSCIELLNEDSHQISAGPRVQEGLCDKGCMNGFYIYLVLYFFSNFFISANRAIANIIFFRSVSERDKDLALGLLNVVLSFSFTVCPTIAGAWIDTTCELWKESCGRRGHCIIYNNITFRNVVFGMPIVGVSLGLVMELLLLRWNEDIDFFGEKEKERLGITSYEEKNDIGDNKK